MRIYGSLYAAFFLALGVLANAQAEKVVVAHRGASGYLPEHTLEAYAMAHAQGVDYIEPDLVLTKDGVFVCLHDVHLEATTDVEERFPQRARKDGRWCAVDFTLQEIKELRVHERLPNRFPMGTADFEVPTFAEMIELVQGLNRSTGRNVGIYPELKCPRWHAKEGLPMEGSFLRVLKQYGYTGAQSNVLVQCFEDPSLKKMRFELGSKLRQVLLIGGGDRPSAWLTPEGLDEATQFAEGIGPAKTRIARDPDIVAHAHARGLFVHVYTLRADDVAKPYNSMSEELKAYFTDFDVDGLWTDHPDVAVKWLRANGAR